MGQDEVTRGEVKIKNLATGEQQAVARAAVASTHSDLGPEPRTSDLGPRTSDIE